MMKQITFIFLFAGLVGCNSQPHKSRTDNTGKILIVTVVDYSRSYTNLVSLENYNVQSLFFLTAKTGGAVVHVGIGNNSNNQSVYHTDIDRLDTANSDVGNIYQTSRMRAHNKAVLDSFTDNIQKNVAEYMQVTRNYGPTGYTDLQQSLQLAGTTTCESIYTQGKTPYKRFVLILSDMLNDPPNGRKALVSVDFCNATVLVVRPSPSIPQDSLQAIFKGSQLYTFTTINDAISFINEQ